MASSSSIMKLVALLLILALITTNCIVVVVEATTNVETNTKPSSYGSQYYKGVKPNKVRRDRRRVKSDCLPDQYADSTYLQAIVSRVDSYRQNGSGYQRRIFNVKK
jgi:hypothetical protein